jgi:serine/threonine-protein kinase
MSDIFISYSRADLPIARLFATGLEHEGFSVWWDQALSAGETFDTATEQALEKARAVVVLWSRNSVESRWVRAEATQAQANNRLVPVMIEPCKRPIMFELTQTADLYDWTDDADDLRWRAFVDGLRKRLGARDDTRAGTPAVDAVSAPSPWRRLRRKRVRWDVAAALCALSVAVGGLVMWLPANQRSESPQTATPLHLSVSFAGAPGYAPVGSRHFDIARDGSRIAFSSTRGLWVRALGSARPVVIDAPCLNPFFSPDASWIGCFDGDLMKIPVDGGRGLPIARTPDRAGGASWGTNGSILFATTAGLFRVAEDGGEPELIARPDPARDERLYAWPELLPDEQHVLLTVMPRSPGTPPRIVQLNLQTRESRVVLTGGTFARYAATGHLVYSVGPKLYAIRFDPESAETRGAAIPVPDIEIATATDNGAAEFAVARDGTLVTIAPRPASRPDVQLSWVDARGEETLLALRPAPYADLKVSPDGARLVFDMNVGDTGNRDIWIGEIGRGNLVRLTNDPAEENLPQWSRDGRRVLFSSNRGGDFDIYSQAADGSGEARLEFAAPGAQFPVATTPDGREVLVTENFRSIGVGDLDSHVLRPLLQGDVEYWLAAISPDGRWLAYESKESGNVEIFLRPYPRVEERREKVSLDGGRFPVWGASDSSTLYYVNPAGEMMAADIDVEPDLRVGGVRKVFDWRPPPAGISGRQFDVSSVDGRFLVPRAQADTDTVTEVSVVLHWVDELRRIAP